MSTTIVAGNATNGAAITSDNTGILELKTGTGSGTTAVTLDASQNVGVGTSSPAANLEVKKTTDNTKLQVTSTYEAALWLVNGGGSEVSVINAGGSNVLSLRTNNTERMRILSTGNILSLSGGSTTATGTGIAFPAVQSASSDANTLDDYEEGTFTPTFDNLTVGNGTSQGRYTKIGRTVFVEVDFVWGSTTSASGTWYVNNLPFTTAATFLAYGSGNILDSGTENYTCLAATNASNTLMRPLANNASVTYLANAGVTATVPMTWTTNDAVRMTLVYTT